MKRIDNPVRHYDTDLFGNERTKYEASYQKTIEDLMTCDPTMNWVIAYSGGKDSTTVVTLIWDAIQRGLITAPKSLTVMYADTGMEAPPLHAAAMEVLSILRAQGIRTQIVHPEMDDRFWVYMLGRGVPPPNNQFRWCTRKLKIEPMNTVMKSAYEQFGERFLLFTGVRQGESAVRDERLIIACSKDGAECGQGRLYVDKTAKSMADTAVPILHWRVCHVWDYLMWYVPAEFAHAAGIVAEIYGGDEARENNARTGCMECDLVSEDHMMAYICKLPNWSYLTPIRRLKQVYAWMRRKEHRLTREVRPGDWPLGPLTMDARRKTLADVLEIQAEVDDAAQRLGRPGVSLISPEERARILELIAANTWPNGWTGDEITGDTLLERHGVTPIELPMF